MAKKPKILFYDIETSPLLAYIWRPGKQVVRHGQLSKSRNQYNIICITYCWNDGKAPKALVFDYEKQDCSKIVKEFDKLVKESDITIGKNSDRFDVKHINAQRFLTGGKPFPDWADVTDDLEKQMRKFFYFPSQSLDYISDILGLGGKIKMQMQDWIDIVEQNKNGKKALTKMVKYGKKDIADTRAVWNKMKPYIKPKFNMSTFLGEFACVHCGSSSIIRNGTRINGKSKYQHFYCNSHGGYAGKAIIGKNGTFGKLGN